MATYYGDPVQDRLIQERKMRELLEQKYHERQRQATTATECVRLEEQKHREYDELRRQMEQMMYKHGKSPFKTWDYLTDEDNWFMKKDEKPSTNKATRKPTIQDAIDEEVNRIANL